MSKRGDKGPPKVKSEEENISPYAPFPFAMEMGEEDSSPVPTSSAQPLNIHSPVEYTKPNSSFVMKSFKLPKEPKGRTDPDVMQAKRHAASLRRFEGLSPLAKMAQEDLGEEAKKKEPKSEKKILPRVESSKSLASYASSSHHEELFGPMDGFTTPRSRKDSKSSKPSPLR